MQMSGPSPCPTCGFGKRPVGDVNTPFILFEMLANCTETAR